jgi:dihydrodipicolinate synthase/N-acetylneuraminate lyase
MPRYPMPPDWVLDALRSGIVIPAHPLALTADRKLDERRQRALTRYYHAAGAGGIAVGVHTTQFAIREPRHGLYKPVLALAAETAAACGERAVVRPDLSSAEIVLVAGVCGPTAAAVEEARAARELGYHVGLLSLGALPEADDEALIAHCRAVGEEIPLMGFYLHAAAGGRLLSADFWRRFVDLENVVAIKIAAFNRYQTLDVVRAVAESGRPEEIALYTGNDDAIVQDLVTEYEVRVAGGSARVHFAGGLLGQWACWTRKAVALLEECKRARRSGQVPSPLLTLGAQLTDANAALFDAANGFRGCIPGILEVLHRQELLGNNLCLDPGETLSPGQAEEIDRVCRAYPHLRDDLFVTEHLGEWLR